jgi:Fic family protein/DNA-binding XRE family transcriptional regulator
MNISQKLHRIQKVTRWTQEKLAKELDVSFATINSWINERSSPRTRLQEKIDALYLEYTGQKRVDPHALKAAKNAIIRKSKSHKNILKQILENPDIYDAFTLSLTYNTNVIEGSTLTERETAAVLFDNASLPNRSLIEQMEAKNHQAALQYLLQHLVKSKIVNEALIKKLHSMLLNSIRDDAGMYRKHSVRIIGTHVPTANYVRIPSLIEELTHEINKRNEDAIAHIARIHAQFEKIHPFADGNGRIGRLLMHAMALARSLPPVVQKQEKKQAYYIYLEEAQLRHNTVPLENFVCEGVTEGFKILERKM